MRDMAGQLRVAVAGLGAIGFKVAATLARGVPGLTLSAVSASDLDRAARRVAVFQAPLAVIPVEALASQADVVVECLPPAIFGKVAAPVLEQGGTLVAASAGALLDHDHLIDLARRTGGRIVLVSGAIVGLDGLRAAAEAGLEEVRLVTRKPPSSFGETIEIEGRRIGTATITHPLCLFKGSARQAIRLFPVNVNVAAALSLAGLGADETVVELWADPDADRNRHQISVRSTSNAFTAEVVNLPDPNNPKSSSITAHSIIAALRRLVDPMTVGS